MVGERMRFAGGTEVSGVCTRPDFRGHGFARRLSSVVAHAIQQRGDQAFLHAWATNAAAIALYESLGFRVRTAVHVMVLGR
ncbi:GNAT family N-acetyltransferase [Acidovorax sp.]|uniref:GNAT family N-acetyltransferase n=1 Tax=Acidovorax sp. TaxID=1872122 RepID=UPI00391A2A2B